MTTLNITQKLQDVLDVIRSSPAGASDQEVAVALGIHDRTANGRRIWLHRRGLVCPVGLQDAGHRIKRTIWRATDG
jgi:hypothetical protein